MLEWNFDHMNEDLLRLESTNNYEINQISFNLCYCAAPADATQKNVLREFIGNACCHPLNRI